MTPPLIDIHPDHWAIVRDILQTQVPQYPVWAFGSRATWKAKEFSDLDLAIITETPLPLDVMASLREAFSDSDLPWKVDVVDWASTSAAFREIIERDKVVVQEGQAVAGEWKECSLGEIFKVKHGFAFKGEFFTDEPKETVLVTPGNFAIGGGFQEGKWKYYNGPLLEEYILRPGQIIVTMTDLSKESDTLGYAARVPKNSITWLHNQRIGLLEFKSKLDNSPNFFLYLLRTREYRSWVIGSATGTTVKHTSPGRIESFKTHIPPLGEQRAIAHVLGALDDKIDLNRRMNATLEAMARALFKDWFVDFGPTRAKLEGRAPYLSPDLWALFPDRLDEEEKPEGWEISTIGEEARVVGGSTPSTKQPEFWDGGINWVTPKDLSIQTAPVLLETARTITDAGLMKISSGLLPVGTVLLSSRAPIGYIAISEIPVAINQGFIAMICNRRISNIFVWLWTLENMAGILAKANGSTFQEISKSNFRPLSVFVSPERLLAAFDSIVGPLYRRIVQNECESRTLAQTRDLLLPKLMSGEIRLNPADFEVLADTPQ